jgi:hypothetical protein
VGNGDGRLCFANIDLGTVSVQMSDQGEDKPIGQIRRQIHVRDLGFEMPSIK